MNQEAFDLLKERVTLLGDQNKLFREALETTKKEIEHLRSNLEPFVELVMTHGMAIEELIDSKVLDPVKIKQRYEAAVKRFQQDMGEAQ